MILNNCAVMYNTDGTWFIAGGGSWENHIYYQSDLPKWAWYPNVGDTKNVGGYDAIGVAVVNQNDTVPGMVRGNAYVHDGEGSNREFYHMDNSNHKDGAIYKYQDFAKCLTSTYQGYTTAYMGHGFSACVVYDSSFKNWNGQAKVVYTHTWDQGEITGISVSNSGFSVSLNNISCGFTIYSNSTVSF